MTNTNDSMIAAPTTTLADFLLSTESENFLTSAMYGYEENREVGDGPDWVASLLERNVSDIDPATSTLDEIECVASNLEGVVTDLRAFIASYFEKCGAFDKALAALEAFSNAPTEDNREKLVAASRPFVGHSLPMKQVDKRKLRPHVTSRNLRSRIEYGSLYWIVKEYVKVTEVEAK